MSKVIVDIEVRGKEMTVVLKDSGLYDALTDGIVTQPDKDAEGIIAYLAHCLHNSEYLLAKEQAKNTTAKPS